MNPEVSTQHHVPAEVKGLNWGAFFLNWIWGIGNSVWISLLALIPFVGIVVPFILLFKGNEWAWKAKHWESVEHFKRVQKIWAIVGLIIFILGILLMVVYIGAIIAIFTQVEQQPQPTGY